MGVPRVLMEPVGVTVPELRREELHRPEGYVNREILSLGEGLTEAELGDVIDEAIPYGDAIAAPPPIDDVIPPADVTSPLDDVTRVGITTFRAEPSDVIDPALVEYDAQPQN